MRCNTKCVLIKQGVSTSTLTVNNTDYAGCIHRNKLPLRRGQYNRELLVDGSITATHCYRDKIKKVKVKRDTSADMEEI